jgi:WD40 repeat protein
VPGHGSRIVGAAFVPSADRVATVGEDRTARLWDWRNQREILRLAEGGEPLLGIAFSPDGSMAALWGGAGSPELLMVTEGRR